MERHLACCHKPVVHTQTDVLDVRREALRVITNLASGGSREQVEYVVAQGAIPALAGVLACDDGSMVIKALEGLKKILTVERTRTGSPEERPWRDMVKERGGVDLLQSLWRHPSRDVYRLAVSRRSCPGLIPSTTHAAPR